MKLELTTLELSVLIWGIEMLMLDEAPHINHEDEAKLEFQNHLLDKLNNVRVLSRIEARAQFDLDFEYQAWLEHEEDADKLQKLYLEKKKARDEITTRILNRIK